MSQRQINAAFARSLKTRYSHLSPTLYRYIKKVERKDQLYKDIDSEWGYLHRRYGKEYRHHPQAQENIELIGTWLEMADKVCASIDRMVDKYGIDEDQVQRQHMMMNCSSQSFQGV